MAENQEPLVFLHIFISFQFASKQTPCQLHPEHSETYEQTSNFYYKNINKPSVSTSRVRGLKGRVAIPDSHWQNNTKGNTVATTN